MEPFNIKPVYNLLGVLILKYIWIGLGLSVLGVVISFIIWGLDKMYYFPAGISIVLIGLCALLSGSLVDGDRMRANYATETAKDRLNKDRFTTKCFFMAIPNIVVTVIFYFLSYIAVI
jgi:hypothetical protein